MRRGVTFGLAARVGPAVVLASMLGLAGVPVGYEPDGALDGLAALLTSRRLHRAGSAAERCLLGVQKRKSRAFCVAQRADIDRLSRRVLKVPILL